MNFSDIYINDSILVNIRIATPYYMNTRRFSQWNCIILKIFQLNLYKTRIKISVGRTSDTHWIQPYFSPLVYPSPYPPQCNSRSKISGLKWFTVHETAVGFAYFSFLGKYLNVEKRNEKIPPVKPTGWISFLSSPSSTHSVVELLNDAIKFYKLKWKLRLLIREESRLNH